MPYIIRPDVLRSLRVGADEYGVSPNLHIKQERLIMYAFYISIELRESELKKNGCRPYLQLFALRQTGDADVVFTEADEMFNYLDLHLRRCQYTYYVVIHIH